MLAHHFVTPTLRRSLLIVALLVFAGCGADAEQASAHPQCPGTDGVDAIAGSLTTDAAFGDWIELAPMSMARIAYAAAVVDGRIHVVGGIGQARSSHEIYDPASDSWQGGADLPVPIDHAWAAASSGRLYVGDGASTSVFCYDPGADGWLEVAPSPHQHGDTPATAVIGGRIFVAGGDGVDMAGNEVSMYDPSSDTWTEVSAMECSRHHTVGGVINGRFHVVGGRPGNQTCHEVYDPNEDRWTRLADLPTGREGMGGAVAGGRLYVFGGEGNPDGPAFLFDAVEAYDPAADAWDQLAAMPNPRHGLFAVAIGDTIFLPGGGRMLSAFSDLQAFVVGR